MNKPHVVIVGGGFGGLNAALALRSAPVRVTLADRRNFHLFQPLLYQVATGALSPANIASPLRSLLRNLPDVEVLLGEVSRIDLAAKLVQVGEQSLVFDCLIVATGATHAYFDHPDWEAIAPGLKTIEDATEIRRRVLDAFERAERANDPAERTKLMTFAIVGGGATGVEMAGAICELSRHTLRHDFQRIKPQTARVLLIEGGSRVLTQFPPDLSQKALDSLHDMGAEVWTGAMVTGLSPGEVRVKRGGREQLVSAETIIWAAGVQASPLGRSLGEQSGATVDRAGRVAVRPDLSLPGHPQVFVIGDLASGKNPDGTPWPGVAPTAIQQGQYVAKRIIAASEGDASAVGPFVYWNKGNMATIGRASAVADLGWIRFSGMLAWLAWLFIHLIFLVRFENRLLVLMQWAWNYVTRNRAARLITTRFPSEGQP